MALLDKDEDNYWFIDYLYALHSEVESGSFRRFLKRHRQIIKAGLHQFAREKSVLAKYEWMAGYHNRTTAKLRVRRADSILI